MKKLISLMLVGCMLMSLTATSFADSYKTTKLTPEQEAVINAFENNEVEKSTSINFDKQTEGIVGIRSSVQSDRKIAYRGSFLMWSEDTVEWTYDGSSVLQSEGNQDVGFIFPNIVRAKGITKMSTSSSSMHKYKAKKTIGAGAITPWGDVTVYNVDFTDYIKVYGSGSASIIWD